MTTTRRQMLATAAGIAAAPATAFARQDTRFQDQMARDFLEQTGALGLQVAIARDGELGFGGAWGYADAQGTSLTHGHRFRIASLSKPITAAGVMRLIETDRLDLDDRVFGPGSLFGGDYGPASGAVRQLRVRHLLSHTCGGWTNDNNDPTMNHPGLNQSGLISHALAQHPLQFMPGTNQSYSNFGYMLLGRVIERVSGRPYEDWMRDNVLAPAGAEGMRVGRTARAADEVAYVSSSLDSPYSVDIARLDANGGWLATAQELLAFVVGVDGTDASGRILRPSSARQMATPPYPGAAFGHGWQVNALDNWWHTGLLPGTSTYMCRSRSGYAFAALTNRGAPGADLAPVLDRIVWRMAAAVPGWAP